MKVKDLAGIFKVEIGELLNLLENVGVNVDQQEETMIDAATEKKLAKKYNVPYPFKTQVKPKPVNKVVIPNAKGEQKTQKTEPSRTSQTKRENVPQGTSQKGNNAPVSRNNQKHEGTTKTAPKGTTPTEKKQEKQVEQPVVKPVHERPRTKILDSGEVIAVKVDEETLARYESFIDEEDYENNVAYQGPGEYRRYIFEYCEKRGIKFEPCDWFDEQTISANHLLQAADFQNTEEFVRIMEEYMEAGKKSIIPFNSDDYNNIVKTKQDFQKECNPEIHKIVWEKRNEAIVNNIVNVIKNNPDSNILVVFGAEHIYWLKNELSKLHDVQLIFPLHT